MTTTPTPELALDAAVRATTRTQYQRVYRWLCAHYPGPWDRTEPLQRFVDDHPSASVRSGARGRVVQCLVNRHLRPRPAGPPIFLSALGRRPARRGKPYDAASADAGWRAFVPGQAARDLLDRDDNADAWGDWLREYVVSVLRGNALRRHLVRTYVAHVHRVLWQTLGCRTPEDVLRVDRDALARAVVERNAGRPGQRRLCRIAVNHFLGGVVLRDHPPLAMRLHLRTRDLPPSAPGGRGDEHPADYAAASGAVAARDHFTAAEMERLLALPDLSRRDRLMLQVMSETGLRRRAVSWLLVDGVFDRAAGAALPVARATEKGLVVRSFVLAPATQALLAAYVRDDHPGPHVRWLFPSPKTQHRRPITPAVVNDVLLRACRQAGIRGRHTHTHAVRKFVVCRLMQARNRIEDVTGARPSPRPTGRWGGGGRAPRAAKWLGHRTVDVTYGTYWDVDACDVAAGMVIPWLR